MKRIVSALLAMLTLAACFGAAPEEPSPNVSVNPNEPVLTRRNVEITVWTDPGAGVEFIDRAAGVFNRRWPNIAVRAEGIEADDIITRVWAESARGGAADLFIAPHMEIRALADALLILPARDQAATKASVFHGCAQSATVDGVIYGYPVTADTVALFYNRRLVNEVPSTWEEMTAWLRGFREEGRHGLVLDPFSAHSAAPFISVRNNRPFGPAGDNPAILGLEGPLALEGMTLLRELGGISGLEPGQLSDAERLFARGEAAFCVTGSWSIARFVEAGIDFGVAPLPAMPYSGDSLASMAFSRVMLVNAYSEQPDEASAFAALLLTEEMQRLRLELTGELPSVELSVFQPHYAAGFTAQLGAAYGAPSIPATARYWQVFTAAAARVWGGADAGTELLAAAAELRAPDPSPEDMTE